MSFVKVITSVVCLSLASVFVVSCGKSGEETDQSESGPVFNVDPTTAGTIMGQVNFKGKVPKPKKIKMTADAFCHASHSKSSVTSEALVVNANKTLRHAFVYIKSGLEGKNFQVPSDPAVLNQVGCWYNPHVLGVQSGQVIQIQNSDEVLHNIHAFPKINKGFNFGQPIKGMKTNKKFTKQEVMVYVKCDVHPWMTTFIGVVDHPYFVVTDDQGKFELSLVPPGEYEVEVWTEKFGTSIQKVTVGPKESKTVNFSFKL